MMESGRRHRFSFKGIFDSPSTMVQLGLVFVLAIIMEELFRRTLSSHTLDLIGVEPDSVLAIERLALTGQLYTDPHTLPFVLLPYGPLVPYAARAIHHALHLETSVVYFYLAGRLVACLSMIALMIGVGVVLVKFLRVKPLLANVVSLLVGLAMYPWGFAVRPDSMYCALGIWSLIAFH